MANKKSDIKLYDGLRFGKMTIMYRDDEKSENAPNHSYEIYIVKCDCGKIKEMRSNAIRKSIKNGSDSNCGNCVSFHDWCVENECGHLLDLWDYDLNDCTPRDISYGSGKPFYFKCKNGNIYHKSEQFRPDRLTSKHKTNSTTCMQCDSIGQYLTDRFGRDNFMSMWSENNELDPFRIARNSKIKVKIICQDCGNEKTIISSNLVWQGLCCSCGDGQSYPNKFVGALLKQLRINYESEKKFKWSSNKVYDYVINDNIILENHGEQHYYGWCGNENDLIRQQENDRLKEKLAKENGIFHYIQLDCRKSTLEWIKNSVINSKLPKLLNFTEDDIDWLKCDEFATKNLVRYVSELWMSREFESTTKLGEYIGKNKGIVCEYLKKGADLGWCDYDAKIEKSKASARNGSLTGKPIYLIKNGECIKFNSATECARQSIDKLGVSLVQSCISEVCRGEKQRYKGFTFKYVDQDNKQ